jgi:hypothetical protein
MDTSRRTAGLGLLAYGLGTPIAYMMLNSPGGDYREGQISSYVSSGHWATAFAAAYLGAFAALGLLPFARRMRAELGSAGDLFWGLSVAGAATAVAGWFMVGGVDVSFAEGGSALRTVPHPVVYLVSEISDLVALCAPALLVGVAAVVLGARSSMPMGLRVLSWIGGVSGILAAFYFPLPLYFLWSIVVGGWALASPSPASASVAREDQPV